MSLRSNALVVLALLCGASIAGCGTFDSGGDGGGSSGPTSPDGGPAGYGGIPASADRVASGVGKLEFRAAREGTVWIGNESRRYQVISRAVSKGDEVVVSPENDVVKVNGEKVYADNLEKDDAHGVYFRSAAEAGAHKPYDSIPDDAEMVATGAGRLEWRAWHTGRIWVGDDKERRLLVSEAVGKDDLIEVEVNRDRIVVNGRVVFEQDIKSKHKHSIFFR